MRIPNWLTGIVILAALAQAALLGVSDAPLGVEGEWTWLRIPVDPAVWTTILGGAVCVGLYTLLVATGARRIDRARRVETAGWLLGLFVAGCAWLWVVIETTPGPFGLGRGPFVVFYPRTSGYFLQARDGLEDWPGFLAGYEEQLKAGDNLHLGTHPPGLTIGYGALLTVCRDNPAFTDLLLAIQPESVREATKTLMATESGRMPDLGRADMACLWLASLLTLLCAVATVWPLYGLLIQSVKPPTAWRLVALWPLVPSVAIFYPKSDLLYPFLAMLFAWLWLTGWERRIVWRCALAGLVLQASLLLSLAFLPGAAIVGLASLLLYRRDRGRVDSGSQCKQGWCAGAALSAFAFGSGLLWLVSDVNLLNVWRLNYVNHASFYDEYPRTWWTWLLVNPVELAVAAGPVVAALALAGAVRALRERLRSPVALSVLLVWGALWLSGKNMGEAARLWIFLMPWLLVVAADGMRSAAVSSDELNASDTARMNRRWLMLIAIQAVLGLVTAHRVDGFHFEELKPDTARAQVVGVQLSGCFDESVQPSRGMPLGQAEACPPTVFTLDPVRATFPRRDV